MITDIKVGYKNVLVLTTSQIAEVYGSDVKVVRQNFERNKDKYISGKHYIELEGEELKEFKELFFYTYGDVKANSVIRKGARHLYLWTEHGALLHAKSLNTEKAWEVYEYLIDNYFHVKENKRLPFNPMRETPAETNHKKMFVNFKNSNMTNSVGKIQNDLICMSVLLSNFSKYLTEEEYKANVKTFGSVINSVLKDYAALSDIKPELIEKAY